MVRPMMPTIVKTTPDRTLFCRKDEDVGDGLALGVFDGISGNAVTVCVEVERTLSEEGDGKADVGAAVLELLLLVGVLDVEEIDELLNNGFSKNNFHGE